MTYYQFEEQVTNAGFTAVACSDIHWQIRGGQRIVNVWPHTKHGLRFQRDGQKAQNGTLSGAIAAAGRTKPKPPDLVRVAPWETSPPDAAWKPEHVGLIRRFWRFIW